MKTNGFRSNGYAELTRDVQMKAPVFWAVDDQGEQTEVDELLQSVTDRINALGPYGVDTQAMLVILWQ